MITKVGLKKPPMIAVCKCGHLFCDHDWGLLARRHHEAGCLVKVGRGNCHCEDFEEE